MKASEVLRIFENYFTYQYTPSDEGVNYGCECGCGGDFYSKYPEEWDKAHEIVYKSRKEMEDLLNLLNIEIDVKIGEEYDFSD